MTNLGVQFFHHPTPFELESGAKLPELTLAYQTWGKLNATRDNVIWVCHALTANSDAAEWWPDMIGPGLLYDPATYFIVCANIPGSCYGSSGPLTLTQAGGRQYYRSFPEVTIRDIVRALQLLSNYLGVSRIHTVTGGSTGAMQALEWAVMEPEFIRYLIPIAVNAQHSPWGIAFNEAQRMALEADPTFADESPDAGQAGLAAARAVALLSYRGYDAYRLTQAETDSNLLDGYRASSYQRYQGQKLVKRFHSHAYWLLTKAMDSHNLGRGRGSVAEAASRIKAKTLVIGISSDLLFPPKEQRLLAELIPDAEYHEIDSDFGHDGFLVEGEQLRALVRDFYKR